MTIFGTGLVFRDTITVGEITTGVTNIDNIFRLNCNLDGALNLEFRTFSLDTVPDFQIPTDSTFIMSKLTAISNANKSIGFGVADDIIGTNYNELLDADTLTPTADLFFEIDSLFTLPDGSFPICQAKKAITTGTMTISGINFPDADSQQIAKIGTAF